MGANIGTTVTAWLLSLTGLQGDSFLIQMLSPNAWSPLLGFAGIALFMFGKDRKKGVGADLPRLRHPHGGHGPDVRRDRPRWPTPPGSGGCSWRSRTRCSASSSARR